MNSDFLHPTTNLNSSNSIALFYFIYTSIIQEKKTIFMVFITIFVGYSKLGFVYITPSQSSLDGETPPVEQLSQHHNVKLIKTFKVTRKD